MSGTAQRVAWLCTMLVAGVGGPNQSVHCQQSTPPVKSDRYGDPLPAGAIARLGTIRFRHGSGSHSVSGLAFLPDKPTLVGAVQEHSICFWDALSGRLLREVSTAPFYIRGFALSRDGRWMAVGGFSWPDDAEPNHEMRILDAATGNTVRTLPRDSAETDYHPTVFSPDGKLLISLGKSGILRIEECETGTEILRQRFPDGNRAAIGLSPDGSTVAVSSGRKIFLWKWQSGEEPVELVGSEGSNNLAFSPDGTQLAAGAEFREPIRIWDVENRRLVQELRLPHPKDYFEGDIALGPDGMSLLARARRADGLGGRSTAVHVWNLPSGDYQRELNIAAERLVFSPDGGLLAASSGSGVRVWRWPALDEIGPQADAHCSSVARLACAADGTVVTASDDGTIRRWDPQAGQQKWQRHHDMWVRAIAVSPDGTHLASSSLDDTVRLWDTSTGREIYRLAGHGRLGGTRGLGFSAGGKRLVSFGDDFYLRVWEVRTGKALVEHKLQPTGVKVPEEGREFLSHIGHASVSSDAALIVLSIGKLFLFDVESGQELRVLENEGGHVVSLAFSPDRRQLLASTYSRPVATNLPGGRVRSSALKNHLVQLWELDTGRLVRRVVLPEGGMGPVAFSADGLRYAVAAGRDKSTITVYETASGKEQFVIRDCPHRVVSLAFARDGRSLVTGLSDSTALVWDLTTSAPP
jgi:WD40 repeat protein